MIRITLGRDSEINLNLIKGHLLKESLKSDDREKLSLIMTMTDSEVVCAVLDHYVNALELK